MKASPQCIALISSFEGFRAAPYLCPAGVPTIGFGSTRYPDGRKVTLQDPPITEDEAAEILAATLGGYEREVDRMVNIVVEQHEFDALVDFAYNCGARNLESSTLLKKLNRGDREGAAAEFGKWVNGGGKVLPGLVRRREAERRLFLGMGVA